MSLGSGDIIIKLAENYFWLTEEKVTIEPCLKIITSGLISMFKMSIELY